MASTADHYVTENVSTLLVRAMSAANVIKSLLKVSHRTLRKGAGRSRFLNHFLQDTYFLVHAILRIRALAITFGCGSESQDRMDQKIT